MTNFSKIINPETNRYVNTHSSIGKQVIKKYLNVYNRGQSGGAGNTTPKVKTFYKDITINTAYNELKDEEVKTLYKRNKYFAKGDSFGASGYHIAKPYNYPRIPIGIFPYEKSIMNSRLIIENVFRLFGSFKLFDGLDIILSTISQDGLNFHDILMIISGFKQHITPERILDLLPTLDHLNQPPKETEGPGKKYEKYRIRLSNLIVESTILSLTIKLGESLPNYMNQIVGDVNSELLTSQKEFLETNPQVTNQVRQRDTNRQINKLNTSTNAAGIGAADNSAGRDESQFGEEESYQRQGGGSARTAALKKNLLIDPKEDYELDSLQQPPNIDILTGIGMLKYFKDKRIGKTTKLERIFTRYKTDWGLIKSNYLSLLQKEDSIKPTFKLVFMDFDKNRVTDWITDFENQVIKNIITNSQQLLTWFKPGSLTQAT